MISDEQLEVKCQQCGIRRGDHQALTLACPEGRKTASGYLHYRRSSKFTASAPSPHCTVHNLKTETFDPRTDVYCGRPGKGFSGYFGNPHKPMTATMAERDRVCDLYAQDFWQRIENDPEFQRRVLMLQGKRLFCFCAPKRCHADTIAEWVNQQPAS